MPVTSILSVVNTFPSYCAAASPSTAGVEEGGWTLQKIETASSHNLIDMREILWAYMSYVQL